MWDISQLVSSDIPGRERGWMVNKIEGERGGHREGERWLDGVRERERRGDGW